ncbi:hypothetical protein [Antarctobacter sp.]|uniref:hypothetical protein n=1 Tax=Antarctobacter sp. TaxID=1872577 RepID=UPI002B266391|nr:hypothetical protein [Antarctobacter sp.]
MQTTTSLRSRSLIANSANWIRKTALYLAQWRQDRQMDRDITRIAETAPHLLADVGFAPEGPANSWHRDGLIVTICHAPDQPAQFTVTPTRSRERKRAAPREGATLQTGREAPLTSW